MSIMNELRFLKQMKKCEARRPITPNRPSGFLRFQDSALIVLSYRTISTTLTTLVQTAIHMDAAG